jgi:predicted HAD superfamily Cof-like phosphohydrolase
LVYVLIGTALEFGIPLQAVWDRVHASNMNKVGGGQDAKGKIQKPPGWIAPDVAGVLREHGWSDGDTEGVSR